MLLSLRWAAPSITTRQVGHQRAIARFFARVDTEQELAERALFRLPPEQ